MSGPDQKRLGDRIRELRRERRLTQEELGARANVSAIHLSHIERSEVDVGLDVVQRIAAALDVPIASLMGELALMSEKALDFAREFEKATPELQAAILMCLNTLHKPKGQG